MTTSIIRSRSSAEAALKQERRSRDTIARRIFNHILYYRFGPLLSQACRFRLVHLAILDAHAVLLSGCRKRKQAIEAVREHQRGFPLEGVPISSAAGADRAQ